MKEGNYSLDQENKTNVIIEIFSLKAMRNSDGTWISKFRRRRKFAATKFPVQTRKCCTVMYLNNFKNRLLKSSQHPKLQKRETKREKLESYEKSNKILVIRVIKS